MNMDYSFSQTLKQLNGLTKVILMYDIACQYSKNLTRRFDQSPHLFMPPNLDLVFGIGLFHVHGHQDSCFPQYAPHFIKGAGHVDGEVIETLWAPLNQISNSTRGMSTAHRKEVIDDHMNDSNFKKLTGIGMVACFLISSPPQLLHLYSSCTSSKVGTCNKRSRSEPSRV